MKNRNIISLLLVFCLMASLCGCNQTKIVGREIDASVDEEIIDLDYTGYDYPTSEEVELGEFLDGGVPLNDTPLVSYVLNPMASGVNVKKNTKAIIDYSNTKDGYVMVSWIGGGDSKIKVRIEGSNQTQYTYDLKRDGNYEVFPLSDGNGEYTVKVFRNTTGTKYATVLSQTMNVTLTDEFAPFIRPNQYVNYNEDSDVVQLASEKCLGVTDNLKKVEIIYNFVVDTLTYDKEKAKTVQSGYLPNVDEILELKKGICFDYASLMAAMLRSQNVPVKLVVGYTGKAYHAWINVWSESEGWVDSVIFFDGKDWKLMDPTFASSSHSSESIMKYIGNGSNYTAKYLY